ncbi:MaoC domain-containing protein dehydratase [Natronococcus amylolyticus DSM 10524]|uniref:MaoC domain-containing protein dehydratase n=1 Tax=Natronococcus amylolyticus DSM 10524 TaxID=1227497 RepID=L9WWP4_9EURY|nr:MaoC family dehydratase N-terminal domain-containing protein [Natronococcus amylolyticus]ELY53904.1 MaoC domain-containing protein dehydratase [Natronococcus amylolyticus DSM 10524]
MHRPTEGETHAFERTFTTEEVRQFAELSRDTQPRHTEPDEEGRLLVHGLLTATLPTKIGSDLEVLASEMSFEFRRPVYTGDRVVCTWSYEEVEELEDRYDLVAAVDCENDAGETVLTATVEGLIWK